MFLHDQIPKRILENEFKECTKPDQEVSKAMKSIEYQKRHQQALSSWYTDNLNGIRLAVNRRKWSVGNKVA